MLRISHRERIKNLKLGSFILGIGILGALDGIVFHQLLQWHKKEPELL